MTHEELNEEVDRLLSSLCLSFDKELGEGRVSIADTRDAAIVAVLEGLLEEERMSSSIAEAAGQWTWNQRLRKILSHIQNKEEDRE